MLVVGADPGLGGAVALLDTTDDRLLIWDMPTHALTRSGKAKREIDAYSLADILRLHRIDHLFIERVGAMPGQGVSSVFAFGQAFGVIRGVASAIGIPMTLVSPAKWKKDLGVPAAKDGARARCSQIFPAHAHLWSRSKDHSRAEALLLAHYGIKTNGW
jgi:crossover junction endodeoxyribonuclease RuvC